MNTLNNRLTFGLYDKIIAEAHNKLGLIYEQEGKFADAIYEYSKALELRPKFAEAYYGRGLSYFLLNDYEKAWEDVQLARLLGFNNGKNRCSALPKAVSSFNYS